MIIGVSLGISVILWVASILAIVTIPKSILFIQLTTHFLVTIILYSFFIFILFNYLKLNFVNRETTNQVILYCIISLMVSTLHSVIYHFIYSDTAPSNMGSFRIFAITFLFQNVFFIPILFIHKKRKPFSGLNTPNSFKRSLPEENKDVIDIVGVLPKEKIIFSANDLLFIKSSDNYSEFHFTDTKGIKRKILRLTLKSIEEQLKCDYIIRSHKSYIVNLKQDIIIKGNANDTKILIQDFTIPVSRSRRNAILELYAKYYS